MDLNQDYIGYEPIALTLKLQGHKFKSGILDHPWQKEKDTTFKFILVFKQELGNLCKEVTE